MDDKSKTIIFSFNQGISDETVASRLDEIKGIMGVFNAYALHPASTGKRFRLMHIAMTDGNVPAEDVRTAIEKVKDVKYAELPTTHYTSQLENP